MADGCKKAISILRNHPNTNEEKIIGSQPGEKKIEAIPIYKACKAKLLSRKDIPLWDSKFKDSQILKIVFGSEKVGEVDKTTLFHTWQWLIKTQLYHLNNKHKLTQIRINTDLPDTPDAPGLTRQYSFVEEMKDLVHFRPRTSMLGKSMITTTTLYENHYQIYVTCSV